MKQSELFDVILERPAMYVGKTSIPLISAFLDGYHFARWENKEDVKDELYDGFNEWVAKRFNIKTAHNWSSIITFMGQSEIASYELTKELWAEYRKLKQKTVS